MATIGIVIAAVARLPVLFMGGYGVFGSMGPTELFLVFFAATDLFLVAAMGYDLATRGRIHPAYLWGGGLLVVSQAARLWLMHTEAWQAFAKMLTT